MGALGIARLTHRDNDSGKAPVPQSPVSLPPAVPQASFPERIAVSLPTGTWLIKPRGSRGRGVLKIHNGTDLDAVVKLVTTAPSPRAVWKLYIRAGDDYTVNGIGVGSYLFLYALGLDWEKIQGKFLARSQLYQAGEPGEHLDFTETASTSDTPDGYTIRHNWVSQEIGLDTVLNGNLAREPIDESVFNEGEN